MIKVFKYYQVRRKKEKEVDIQIKLHEIKNKMIGFFQDLQDARGEEITMPAWIEASQLMDRLKINQDNPRIVNRYYRNLKRSL